VEHGGDRHSREAKVAARERQVVQLYIRGLTWGEIARQLSLNGESGARMAFNRAIKRIPPADVELLRKLEGERISDLRRRIWSEFAGRHEHLPDPNAPGEMKTVTVRPDIDQVNGLIDRAVKVGRHESRADCRASQSIRKRSIVPQALKATRAELYIPRRVSHLTMPQIRLNEPQVGAVLGEMVSGGVAETVGMNVEGCEAGASSDAVDHELDRPVRERTAAFRNKDKIAAVRASALEPPHRADFDAAEPMVPAVAAFDSFDVKDGAIEIEMVPSKSECLRKSKAMREHHQ
jgi:hypothetical protein